MIIFLTLASWRSSFHFAPSLTAARMDGWVCAARRVWTEDGAAFFSEHQMTLIDTVTCQVFEYVIKCTLTFFCKRARTHTHRQTNTRERVTGAFFFSLFSLSRVF